MTLPNDVRFLPWTPWAQRDSVPGSENPGVYLLALLERPANRVNPLDPRVIYIGETVSQTLASRWYQFNRSAFQGKAGHSGGWTYRSTFRDSGRNLCVAALPVATSQKHYAAYIRYVERLLIWESCVRHGAIPCCNRK